MIMAAMRDPYHSVDAVYPLAINGFNNGKKVKFIGVKNTPVIPKQLLDKLEATDKYRIHTLDGMAYGGRGIDVLRVNPVTGRPMTGSSSGTAMNVFLHFNEAGIGTDGGGSVLAPAISLNLFGFISPLIENELMQKYEKKSTDGITFRPSLGYISRQYDVLRDLIEETIKTPLSTEIAGNIFYWDHEADIPDKKQPRELLIPLVSEYLKKYDCICSVEGPIDFEGIGDTVFGHFSEKTKEIQLKAEKGLVRIANMVGATAVCIPQKDFAQGTLFLCESKSEKICKMLNVAEKYITEQDPLIERYFGNMDQYFHER